MGTVGTGGEPLSAAGLSLVIVAARYNEPIVAGLLSGAQLAWAELGGAASELRVERVPGAFELPLAARAFALGGRADAIVALGCVIRGDTAHFDFVAGECAHGLQRVMLDTGVPVSFGVLTTDTEAQAQQRSAPGSGNKGAEAIETAVAMALLLRRV
jgi:6,7-dimethyl-8-ribityllumazine synthase